MIDVRLHDEVVEQGRLLLQLLSAVREQSGQQELGDDALHIADLLFHGLDRIYAGLDDVVASASVAGGEPDEVSATERAYPEIIEHLRDQVTRHVPSGEIVAVVTRGDSALVDFPGSTGWHFPQNEVGTWAGHHPRDGADALMRLDVLRTRGARFLAVPATCGWWLDWYVELAQFLDEECTTLVHDDMLALFALPPLALPAFDAPTSSGVDAALSLSRVMSMIIPPGAMVFEVAADAGSPDRVVTRTHGVPATDVAASSYLVVDATVRERMKALTDEDQQPGRANCLFDRTGVGSIFELSDRVEADNEDKGAWV